MECCRDNEGKVLLHLARAAIAGALHVPHAALDIESHMAWLAKPGATFVTLMQRGELRGCIGSLQASDPLIDDVSRNALSAAFRDPRFAPVTVGELDTTGIEVSLLSELQPIDFVSEADALNQLRPHIDGVVFEYGSHRSTFLPQIWEDLPQPRQFLARLKLKARLPENFWSEGVKLSRYTVSKWREADFVKGCVHG